jgi:anthranilate phosphoribosyltransferase
VLLRVKEESPEEIAGFVRAVRKTFDPALLGGADVDWSCYAGKKRQLPWFLLSALCLARSGRKVFMHGFDGHTAGRLYTGDVLRRLGLPPAETLDRAALLKTVNFAYVDLSALSKPLARMMCFKPILGLRSPVHTLARMLNPFGAPCLLQGVFHPNYMNTHRGAAELLGEKNMVVFRGEGGEIERRPGKPCETMGLREGAPFEERWPPIIDEPRQLPDDDLDVARLISVWRGETRDEYGEAAVVGTMALALKTMGAAADQETAQAIASDLWHGRDRLRLAEAV